MDDDPDLILMRGVAAGTPGAFETLRRRYVRFVRQLVRARISDHHAADDTTQEILVKLWRTAGRFDPSIATLSTWVAVITRRAVYDAVRARMRARSREALCLRVPRVPPTTVEAVDDLDEVRHLARKASNAMERTMPTQAAALDLVYRRGMAFKQAWTVLGVPEGTLKQAVSRGLDEVRWSLGVPSARRPRRPRPRQATRPPAPTSP